MNVKFEYLNSDAIRIDGEIFYYCEDSRIQPFMSFSKMLKIRFVTLLGAVGWDKSINLLTIPIGFVENRTIEVIETYVKYRGLFFLKEDKKFVDELKSKYVDSIFSTDSIESQSSDSIVSSNKLPKVISVPYLANYYFIFDEQSCNKLKYER